MIKPPSHHPGYVHAGV